MIIDFCLSLFIVLVAMLNPSINRYVASAVFTDGKALPYREVQKTYPLIDEGKSRPIYLFLHICTQGEHWRTILESQMKSIVETGLYDKSHTIWYGCSCHMCVPLLKDYFASYDKVKPLPRAMCADKPTYENATLNDMIRFCARLPYGANCLYIHTKGTTAKSQAQHAWREYMMYWLLDRHEVSIDLLNRGFDTVGTLYQKFPVEIYGYSRLYSGNFFWVKSEYMRELPQVTNMSNRFLAEQLIFKKYRRGKHACLSIKNYLSIYIPFKAGLYQFPITTKPIPDDALQIIVV